MKKTNFIFLFWFCCCLLQAGNPDSLLKIISVAKEDSNKVRAYINLANEYKVKKLSEAIKVLQKGIELSAKLKDKVLESYCHSLTGMFQRKNGDLDGALLCFDKSLLLRKALGDKKGMAANYLGRGLVYKVKGEYERAIAEYRMAKEIFAEIKDTLGIADIHNSMGTVFSVRGVYDSAIYCYSKAEELYSQLKKEVKVASAQANIATQYFYNRQFDKAFAFYVKSLAIFEKVNDKNGMATCILWQGNIYGEKKEYPKALERFMLAKKLYEEVGGKYEQAFCYSNLGSVNMDMGNYLEALKNYKECLKIREENGIGEGLPFLLERIGNLYTRLNDISNAMRYLERSEKMALEMKALDDLKNTYMSLTKACEAGGKFEKAFYYQSKLMEVKDSLFNENNNRVVKELTTKYDTDKNEKEIALLNKDKALQEVKFESERNFRYMMSGVAVLVMLLAIALFRGLILKNKSNKLLIAQKHEISEQRDLIEEKQKEIIDSIQYAKRIQQALITSEKYFEKNLDRLQDKN